MYVPPRAKNRHFRIQYRWGGSVRWVVALSRRLVHPRLRLLEKDVIVLLEEDVNCEEQRQSRSSSGWVSPLHVQRTACSCEFPQLHGGRVAFGRKASSRSVRKGRRPARTCTLLRRVFSG